MSSCEKKIKILSVTPLFQDSNNLYQMGQIKQQYADLPEQKIYRNNSTFEKGRKLMHIYEIIPNNESEHQQPWQNKPIRFNQSQEKGQENTSKPKFIIKNSYNPDGKTLIDQKIQINNQNNEFKMTYGIGKSNQQLNQQLQYKIEKFKEIPIQTIPINSQKYSNSFKQQLQNEIYQKQQQQKQQQQSYQIQQQQQQQQYPTQIYKQLLQKQQTQKPLQQYQYQEKNLMNTLLQTSQMVCYQCQTSMDKEMIQLKCFHLFHSECFFELISQQILRDDQNSQVSCHCFIKISNRLIKKYSNNPINLYQQLLKKQLKILKTTYQQNIISCTKCDFFCFNDKRFINVFFCPNNHDINKQS